jgi:hypothetical protein
MRLWRNLSAADDIGQVRIKLNEETRPHCREIQRQEAIHNATIKLKPSANHLLVVRRKKGQVNYAEKYLKKMPVAV